MDNNPTTIGRFQIISPIARGGMGKLYLAWDPNLDRHIAIKILNEDNEELRERFAREARSAARLRHPHIVTIFDVGEDNGRPFIAMEYVQGKTLSELIRSRAPLITRRKLELIEELCDGLGFAHKAGIVHRDIKPANIMVDVNGEVKILDFGIARVAESTGVTRAGALMGSLNYMSPEQIGGRPVDQRSDIFAVGAVFYELLSYRMAFPGGVDDGLLHRLLHSEPESLVAVCREIDPDVVRVVARCLTKNPDQRYPDLSAVLRDLRKIQSRQPTSDDSTSHLDESGSNAPAGSARLAPTPTPDSPRRGIDREEVARRRVVQIQTYLEAALDALASADYEGAISACEEVLLRDVEHGRALELLDRARAGLDERRAEEWLAQAEHELRRGALTAALTLIERAEALSPASIRAAELRRTADEAKRERERARQRAEKIRQLLERAHRLFDEGLFREADAAADETLALDPNSPEATRLKSQAAEAIEAHRRAELERKAREAVREARRLFGLGSHDPAIELLTRFQPEHQLVSQALEQLRAEAARIAEQRRIEAERRRIEAEQRRMEADRRAKQQRIAGAILNVRAEMDRQRYADALQLLQKLIDEEGESPQIQTLVQEAKAGQAELDRRTSIAREVSEHCARAAGLFARHDLTGALSRVDAALALDAGNLAASALRTRIQESVRVATERREAEERRARERQQSIAATFQRAEHAESHDAAIAILNDVLEMEPDHAEARALLGRHHEALAREQAERRRALEQQAARREQINQLIVSAHQAFDRGDLDAARAATQSVLELDSENPDATFLNDDIARVRSERAQSSVATSAALDDFSTEDSIGITLSHASETEVARDAPPMVSSAAKLETKLKAKPVALVRPAHRRSAQLRIYVLASAVTAIAAFGAIGYLALRGPAPAHPISPEPSQTASVDRSPARPPATSPPSPSQEVPASENPTVPGNAQVAALLDQARQDVARGDWQGGLATAAVGLKMRPGDPELLKLIDEMWRESQDQLNRERATAAAGGRSTVGSNTYRTAVRREQESNRLARAGQLSAAIPASREAGALYRQAGAEGRLAADTRPSATNARAPSASGSVAGTPRSEPSNVQAAPPSSIPVPPSPGTPPPAVPQTTPSPSAGTNAAPAQVPQPTPQRTQPPAVATPSAPTLTSPTTQPAPTPPQTQTNPPPTTSGGRASPLSEEPAIRAVLSAYASAYSSLDAGAVKRVYPAVNEQDLKRRFADIRSQQVQIQNEQIAVSGDAATVTCTVITVFQGQVGASRRISLQAVFRLEKRNNAWVIVSRQ